MNITLPSWLPEVVKSTFEEFLNLFNQHYHSRAKNKEYYQWEKYLNQVLPAFNNDSMKVKWEKLVKLSPDGTFIFTIKLLLIEHNFDDIIKIHCKDQVTIRKGKKILSTANTLVENIKTYKEKKFDGQHYVTEMNHWEMLYNHSKELRDNLNFSIEEFRDRCSEIGYYANSHWTISRQHNMPSNKGKAIFYARKVHLLFKNIYGKPLHTEVADVINAIFETTYSANDIIKQASSIKKFDNKANVQPWDEDTHDLPSWIDGSMLYKKYAMFLLKIKEQPSQTKLKSLHKYVNRQVN